MEITEIRLALRDSAARPGEAEGRAAEKRLRAYATLTFDQCFVVRNIKVIEGKNGLFVAMPSHKPKVACEGCRFKNDLGSAYCGQCGSPVKRMAERVGSESGAVELPSHRDIAHPITAEFRHYLQERVLQAYRELEGSQGSPPAAAGGQPG